MADMGAFVDTDALIRDGDAVESAARFANMTVLDYCCDSNAVNVENTANSPQPHAKFGASRSNIEAALRYADAGAYVFAARSSKSKAFDKRPMLVRSWNEESTRDYATIRRFFKDSTALVAVDCGKSRIVVIDADRHGGPDGIAALREILGHDPAALGCPIIETAGGGLHLVFARIPDGKPFGNGEGALKGRGINVRGAGGYVIGMGSVCHDGRTYRQMAGTPDLFEALSNGTLTQVPEALAGLIRAPKEAHEEPEPEVSRQTSTLSAHSAEHHDERIPAWRDATVAGILVDFAKIVEGGRNNHLAQVTSFRLGRLAASGYVSKAQAWEGCKDACQRNGLWKDDGPDQCRKSFESGFAAGFANPHPGPGEQKISPEDDEAMRIGAALAEGNLARYSAASHEEEPEMGDVLGERSSANDTGHGDARENASGAQTKSAPLIKATPYSWPECSSIPPREWLYGHHLIRGFVSVTGSPGGVGKSSLLFAEAASMVSGRALLHGVAPVEPLNVWIWNGEDPIVELNRRVAATMKHFGIKPQDCEGRLFVDSGRDTKIVIAETTKSGTTIIRPVVKAIKATIAEHKIDVVVIDPFVSSHRASENDNNAMDAITREWADIADHTGCAIELVHHVRKTGDFEVTVEMLRGGSALVSAARSARVLNPMTSEEAKKAGVENRRSYFRVNNGKSNMSPSSENAMWFHMHSVDLENRGRYLNGDSIGVVTEWKLPDPLEDVTAKDLQAVLQAVGAGRWRESPQSKDWVGRAVAEALGLDVEDEQAKAKIKGLLKVWIKNGALAVAEGKDEKRMDRKFVEVGSAPDG